MQTTILNTTAKFLFLFFILGIIACDDDDQMDTGVAEITDIVILNEGGFMAGNASISTLDLETNEMTNNVFESANDFLLGDIAESIYFGEDGLAHIVVNNSQKIEIVNAADFSSQGTLTDFASPRYYQPVGDGFAMVSNLGAGTLDVIDLFDSERTTIDVSCVHDSAFDCGNEQILSDGEYIYVASLADMSTRIFSASDFSFVSRAPSMGFLKNIALDQNGVLWMISRDASFSTLFLEKVNLSDINAPAVSEVGATAIAFTSVNMIINEAGDQLYFIEGGGNVSRMGVTDSWENRTTIYSNADLAGMYGFGVDPEEEFLYVSDAKNFAFTGEVLKIDIATGLEVERYEVGVAPSKFYFR